MKDVLAVCSDARLAVLRGVRMAEQQAASETRVHLSVCLHAASRRGVASFSVDLERAVISLTRGSVGIVYVGTCLPAGPVLCTVEGGIELISGYPEVARISRWEVSPC